MKDLNHSLKDQVYAFDNSHSQFYPYLVIYHPAYPHIHLYPELAGRSAFLDGDTPTKQVQSLDLSRDLVFQLDYPVVVTYLPVYPHVEPYPPIPSIISSPFQISIGQEQSSGQHPYDLRGHRHDYPHIEPYPRATSRRSKRQTHATIHDKVFRLGYITTPSATISSNDKQLLSGQQDHYDLRGHQHNYTHVDPYQNLSLKGVKRKTHADLHRSVLKDAHKNTPPSTLSPTARLQWNLHTSTCEYPSIEPYPALKSKSSSQGRVKRLALALNERSSRESFAAEQIGAATSPIQAFAIEVKRASRRISHSFVGGLYSPMQPPPISPPLC